MRLENRYVSVQVYFWDMPSFGATRHESLIIDENYSQLYCCLPWLWRMILGG